MKDQESRLILRTPDLFKTLSELVKAGNRALDSDIELSEHERNKAMNELWSALRAAEKLLAELEGGQT